PSAVVVLDALPLNANGKVDRKALPAAELASERDYEAPQGEAEQALAAIWSQVLGVGRIGRHDNFFELGGHSLLALKVIARVQSLEDPALKLSLPALMQKQTIAALQVAEAYEAAQRDHAASPPPAPVGVRRLNGGGRDAAAAAPLFCIAPGLRSALDYRPLARHLDGRCEVYGLSLGEAGRRDGLASMAADLAEAIRRTRPAGPVALLGWSLGAPMALHVAAQLEAWGRDVVFVGLVDSYVATGRFDSGLWYDDLRRFVEEVATDRAGKARVGEVLDRFESVRHADGEAMDRAVRGILGELDIDAGGLDIVARASAARRYYAAIADAPPLAGLKAAPSLYWCRRRGEEEKAKLRQELPLAPRTVVQIDADHQGIVRHEVLFTEVARELVVAGGSRARWHSEPGGGGAG
ncbi:MAG: hypothetical protein J7603_06740, partial [Pseudacidovorax sp.]|nr:hypothetical protein [Pseudacidovorax sp.]